MAREDMRGDDPMVIFNKAKVKVSTAKAVRVVPEGGDDEKDGVWIPKSVMHDDTEVWEDYHPPGKVVVKTWWAERNGHGPVDDPT